MEIIIKQLLLNRKAGLPLDPSRIPNRPLLQHAAVHRAPRRDPSSIYHGCFAVGSFSSLRHRQHPAGPRQMGGSEPADRPVLPLAHRQVGRKKHSINKYGPIGLALFVAIPLPLTGAWSGAVLAFLLGIRKRHAFFAILAGVILAGLIVTAIAGGVGSLIN